MGCNPIIGVTGGGERLDHALGALLAFASPQHAAVRVEVHWDAQHLVVVHGPGRLELGTVAPGAIVSLLPVHGDAVDVATSGLAYPLDHEPLPAGTSRGISNLGTGAPAAVSIGAGTLLVISPMPSPPAEPEGS
jgi:thiamine pyrophosphokinase